MDRLIDLRSDTVTRPSAGMRAAMAHASVGDDVFDDDPSVHRLQEMAARIMGKEAALFMPSGTMSNAVAIKVHTRPGDEILLDSQAHSMLYEAGNPATIANALTRQFHSDRGIPDVDEIAGQIREESLHSPRTALILLENSHNRAGGAVIPLAAHQAIHALATRCSVPVHLDGARVFNAAVALDVAPSRIAANADTVTFCLSKGLGCPVGSVLCGPAAAIRSARRIRKMLGGGMRQAGILAAAGIYALENHLDRLAEDHANARRLAAGLSGAPGLVVETDPPTTNMVYLRTEAHAETITDRLKKRFHVHLIVMGPHLLRAVAHLDVGPSDIDFAVEAIRAVCAESAAA